MIIQTRAHRFRPFMQLTAVRLTLVVDAVRFLRLCRRRPPTLTAENRCRRKQRALSQERHGPPRRATNATRLALVWLGRWFDWRHALAMVTPQTFPRWQRRGFRLFWRWQSKPRRPALPQDWQALMRRMALENPHTLAETRPAGLTSNGAHIHARPRHRRPRQRLAVSTLVPISPQSCQRHPRV